MSICEIRVSYTERASSESSHEPITVRNSRDVMALMAPLLEPEVVEVCYVLCLAAPMTLIGYHQVSRGSLSETLMHPREIFKTAVLANAAAIVVIHNHPSGDPKPSREDLDVTARLKRAGQLLGIDLLDHVIIGHHGLYVSLKERGEL
jgi:DNA repair protein RadC